MIFRKKVTDFSDTVIDPGWTPLNFLGTAETLHFSKYS